MIVYDDHHVSSPYVCRDTMMNVNHFVEMLSENRAPNTKAQNHADSYVFNKIVRVRAYFKMFPVPWCIGEPLHELCSSDSVIKFSASLPRLNFYGYHQYSCPCFIASLISGSLDIEAYNVI